MAAQLAMPPGPSSEAVIPRGGRFRGQWNLQMKVKPDYTFLGYHVSAIKHPIYPWPEGDVRLIRNYYDEHYVPIWRSMHYRTAAGAEKVFLHHGIARFDPRAKADPLILRLDMPHGQYGADFRHPNIVERWFENKAAVRPYSARALYQLPPPSIYYAGDWLVDWAANTFWDATWEEKREFNRRKEDEKLERIAKNTVNEEAEAEYRKKGEANYFEREMEKVGTAERKEVVARQTGNWVEPVKPFADRPATRFTGEKP